MPAKKSAKQAEEPVKKGGGRDLTKGSVRKTLILMSLPVMLGFGIQVTYNLVDTYFVSLLGTDQLAAISVTFPVIFIFIAIASGLSVGSTALMSHAIGAGKKKEAGNIAIHSLILAGIIGTAIAISGLIYTPWLFEFMGVHGSILEMTISYSNIIFIGFVFLFIGNIAQGIIQAGGDTMTPTRNLIISAVLNIILDPIFIFGWGPVPAMGMPGAAIATILGMLVGAGLNIWHVYRGKSSVCLHGCDFKSTPSIYRKIITTGLPTSISNSLNSFGMILMMSFVGAFGTLALATIGVGFRLESLVFMPQIGIMIALIPFVGQNLGAGKIDRAREAVRFACYSSMALMAVFITIWFLFPEALFSPFTSDPEIIAMGSVYFRTIILGYLFLGLNFTLSSAFSGAGRTGLTLSINLLRWIFIIMACFLLLPIWGLQGIWLSFPIGNICGFVLAYTLYKKDIWLKGWKNGKPKKRKLPDTVPETI